MTQSTENSPRKGEHDWREMNSEETADARKRSREGRPSGAWLEKLRICPNCEAMEADVTWFGEGFRVPVVANGSKLLVQWPKRTGERSGTPPGMATM